MFGLSTNNDSHTPSRGISIALVTAVAVVDSADNVADDDDDDDCDFR